MLQSKVLRDAISTSGRKRKNRSTVRVTPSRTVRRRIFPTPAYFDGDRDPTPFSDATPSPESPRSEVTCALKRSISGGSSRDAQIDTELSRRHDMAKMALEGISPVVLTGRNIEEWREGIIFQANLIDAAWILRDDESDPAPRFLDLELGVSK